jgi:uncharacterized protein (DUF4415 family)
MQHKPDPELLDADAPEATDEWFAKARPAVGLLSEILGPDSAKNMLASKHLRGAPAPAEEHDDFCLDSDVLAAFKATGAGWQARANIALGDWLKMHREATGGLSREYLIDAGAGLMPTLEENLGN